MKHVLFTLLLLLGQNAWAEVFQAVISSKYPATEARINGNGPSLPLSASDDVQQDLSLLEVGDLVVGEGILSKERIHLSSLDSVGKKKILGSWREIRDQRIFVFRDFKNLKSISPTKVGAEAYQYSLVPEGHDRWTIFLSDEQQVRIGSMALEGQRNMLIELFDSKTGKVQDRLDLTAL